MLLEYLPCEHCSGKWWLGKEAIRSFEPPWFLILLKQLTRKIELSVVMWTPGVRRDPSEELCYVFCLILYTSVYILRCQKHIIVSCTILYSVESCSWRKHRGNKTTFWLRLHQLFSWWTACPLCSHFGGKCFLLIGFSFQILIRFNHWALANECSWSWNNVSAEPFPSVFLQTLPKSDQLDTSWLPIARMQLCLSQQRTWQTAWWDIHMDVSLAITVIFRLAREALSSSGVFYLVHNSAPLLTSHSLVSSPNHFRPFGSWSKPGH